MKRHKQQQDWEVILKHTQTVGLIFLISVFISLGYFRWNLPKSKGATFSERNLTLSFMIIVGIQIVTLSKYIESEKLNVEDPFFAFTLPNWYAPSLISDISNIDQEIKIDESPPIYILPPEMDEVLKSIDNLSKKVGTLEENMENYIYSATKPLAKDTTLRLTNDSIGTTNKSVKNLRKPIKVE